jgi:hypothetical protein
MFHHMMNHMTVMVGPMHKQMGGMAAGNNGPAGMGMLDGGAALSRANGPSLGRGMGELTGNERAVRTGGADAPKDDHSGHQGHEGHGSAPADAQKVPGYPADMMDMMGMFSEADQKKLNKPQTRGMRRNWFAGIEALHTVVRVLPPDLYDKVVSGKGEVEAGASVPGGGPGEMGGHHHHD